jgi:hypothetical protein
LFPLPELEFLPSGTVVENGPPAGWSHLIIKSMPSLGSGDLGSLPSSAKATATLLRTAIVADVERADLNPPQFHLARVGLGLCVPFEGVDTVVESARPSKARDSLGMIDRQVLAHAEVELKQGRLLARTATFALFAGPSTLRVGSEHKRVLIHYALLVDPKRGGLETLVWSIRLASERGEGPESLTLIPTGLLFQCALDVSADWILGTVPYSWSFALNSLPPGTPVAISKDLREGLLQTRKLAADPHALESRLRALLPAAQSGPIARPAHLPR